MPLDVADEIDDLDDVRFQSAHLEDAHLALAVGGQL